MTNCIKTGAWVYLEEYGFSAPADIFAVGEHTRIVKFNTYVMEEGAHFYRDPPCRITHYATLGSSGWWREDIGTLVIPAIQLRHAGDETEG